MNEFEVEPLDALIGWNFSRHLKKTHYLDVLVDVGSIEDDAAGTLICEQLRVDLDLEFRDGGMGILW